jgi:hypothetical protein
MGLAGFGGLRALFFIGRGYDWSGVVVAWPVGARWLYSTRAGGRSKSAGSSGSSFICWYLVAVVLGAVDVVARKVQCGGDGGCDL